MIIDSDFILKNNNQVRIISAIPLVRGELMKEYSVSIKPLTPLWTGDAKGECSNLRESGIIGSLRWWYEALLRGLGFNVCDPTNENLRCKLNQKKFYEALNRGKSVLEALNEQKICPACQLFGCSGWARKFSLEINGEVNIENIDKRDNMFSKRKVAGLISNEDITLKFRELKEITKQEYCLLNKTLEIIANYGALGSRISQGNGVIKISKNELPVNNFTGEFTEYNNLSESKGSNKTNNNNLPNIKNFHFYKFVIEFEEDRFNEESLWKNHNILPIAFHIRDAIRSGKGSKIFVSHGYKIDTKTVEFRIWGYDAEKQLEKIKKDLNSFLPEKLFSQGKDKTISIMLINEAKGQQIIEVINCEDI